MSKTKRRAGRVHRIERNVSGDVVIHATVHVPHGYFSAEVIAFPEELQRDGGLRAHVVRVLVLDRVTIARRARNTERT